MNDKIIACMIITVLFVGFAYLMNEVITEYRYCKKRREQEKQELLDRIPKNLKM